MIILGLDPGIHRTGWGAIKLKDKSTKLEVVGYGCIETTPNAPQGERLLDLYEQFKKVAVEYNPDVISLEQLFFRTNITTAMVVSRASGVILLLAEQRHIPVVEYAPLQIKTAITGYGRAEKGQMQRMVQVLLNLDKLPKPDDAADGLALALCHAVSMKNET